MNKQNYRIIQPESTEFAFPLLIKAQHLINGAWKVSESGKTFTIKSPSHGHVVGQYPLGSKLDTQRAIKAARAAFDDGRWSKLSGQNRSSLLMKVADLIDRERDRIALLETMENGKPISQANAEIEAAAEIWRYAAAAIRTLHGETHNTLGEEMLGLTLQQPIGVVGMITPWNFPFLIISQKLPFALAAGCTTVIKPSELTSGTTVVLGELLLEAGIPDGVVNIVLGRGNSVGAELVNNRAVDMVSFTGSTKVGKSIVSKAATTLKKVSLELGGKNPQVLFADADVDQAIDAIVFGIYFNAGECCNSGSKIIVHKSIATEVINKVVALSRKVPFGDPLNPQTKVGAIISQQHVAKIDGYVANAKRKGAKLQLGGKAFKIAGLAGSFYLPTVVSKVTSRMPITNEEVFGPVLVVQEFGDYAEALALANASEYGLSAGVWSKDAQTCMRFCRELKAGTIWLNSWMDGYPELPFGGMKQSGQGRELGRLGLAEFTETKTVQLRTSPRIPWV